MDPVERIREILRVLDFTPETLSKNTEISPYRAKKIFEAGSKVKWFEFVAICKLTGVSPNLLTGTGGGRA